MNNLIALAVTAAASVAFLAWVYWVSRPLFVTVPCRACHEESQGTYCVDGAPLSPCDAHRNALCVECGCVTDQPYSGPEVMCVDCIRHLAYAEELETEWRATYSVWDGQSFGPEPLY